MKYQCNLCTERPYVSMHGMREHHRTNHKIAYKKQDDLWNSIVTEVPDLPTCREVCEVIVAFAAMGADVIGMAAHDDRLPKGMTLIDAAKAALEREDNEE